MDAETPTLPWEEMATAIQRLEDARRALELATDEVDRRVAEDDLKYAQEGWELAKQHVAALGNLLLLFALREMGLPLQKEFAAAFGGLAQGAWEKAMAAGRRANRALDEIDVLKLRLRELEEQVAKRTPGVGDPGLRVVG